LAHLTLSFLGAWKVLSPDGAAPHFKYDKVRGLLTYLAVESNRPHRREALMELFWPELPETAARNNLRQALASLKEALGDRQSDPAYLLVSRASVQFNPEGSHFLDIDEFIRLTDAVSRHVHRRLESCRRCIQMMQQAVELYRGPFLNDFYLSDSIDFEEWAVLKREWLHQQALALLGRLASSYERKGMYSLALQVTQRQLELDPWREEAFRQAMRLYTLSGDRDSALSLFEKCRRILSEEIGVDPEPETNALYSQILNGNSSSSQISTSSRKQKSAEQLLALPAKRPHNLPPVTAPFVNRETEMADIGNILEENVYRLITLTGPGGSGKTRLAIQAATEQIDSFTDGVFFVSLAPLQSTGMLPDAISSAIGLETDHKTSHQEKLLAYLKEKEILIVLDSFEHLLEGAEFLSSILRQAPEVTLLVSSQARLNLTTEYTYRLEGFLPPPDAAGCEEISKNAAVQLFIQSAQKVQRSFKLTPENCAYVARICSVTAGLPLAIELAAAWVRALSCREIAEEIGEGIGFLKTNLLDIPERHRSLTAVFDYSWQMLASEEKVVMGGLSIFQGGFSRAAGEAVAGSAPALLAALVDKSLLRRNHTGRYEIHEMVRRYGLEKMASAGILKDVRRRHAAYFLALTEEAERYLVGSEQAEWLGRLREENDNIRFALNSSLEDGEGETAGRIASAIWRFWQITGQISEGRAWLERILENLESRPKVIANKTMEAAAPASLRAGVYKAAGVMAWLQGDYAQSKTYFETGLRLYKQEGDRAGVATLYGNLGTLAIHRTDYQEAQTLLGKALDLRRELVDRWGIASCLNNLGALAGRQGDILKAQSCYQECLDIFHELGYQSGIAISLSNLGSSAGDLGDCDRAYQLHNESLAIRRQLGDKSGIANSLSDLGSVAYQQGKLGEACSCYVESLELLRELGDKEHILDCLEGIAEVASALEQVENAARLWGAAEALRDAMNAPISKGNLSSYTESVSMARSKLTPENWGDAWEQGRRLTLEQAIPMALKIARERISPAKAP
jgi:predicted ATPase/DNA-binding SARP family transcriptional activator